MLAVDTNRIIRALTGDDPPQAEKAPVFVTFDKRFARAASRAGGVPIETP